MLREEMYYTAISDLVKQHERAIWRSSEHERVYKIAMSEFAELQYYFNPHPLSGLYYINHAALPPVGFMNQEFIFVQRLERLMNAYNKVILDKPSSGNSGASKGHKNGNRYQ